jgi:hypothetical protein
VTLAARNRVAGSFNIGVKETRHDMSEDKYQKKANNSTKHNFHLLRSSGATSTLLKGTMLSRPETFPERT